MQNEPKIRKVHLHTFHPLLINMTVDINECMGLMNVMSLLPVETQRGLIDVTVMTVILEMVSSVKVTLSYHLVNAVII